MKFIVTAGPTREHLDPVRFLSNPSTGRMGFAVARGAVRRGHEVVLIAGPVALRTPAGVKRVDVVSAEEMLAAVRDNLSVKSSDGGKIALVMTAAVADWRPADRAERKLKKGEMAGVLKLVRNPDILKTVAKDITESKKIASVVKRCGLIRVGFAAETGAPVSEAARKCREKSLDLVVGNDVTAPGAGFGTVTNRVTFVTPDGKARPLPLQTKNSIADKIVSFCEKAGNR